MIPYFYDLETYPNCFLFGGKTIGQEAHVFEISDRKNQRAELLQWLNYLQNLGVTMVGFNSLQFDYPIVHDLLSNPYTFTAMHAHLLGKKIIESQQYGRGVYIRPGDRFVPQVDLVKVNHFDNDAKRTSLKSLQVAMRSESVEDLPFALRPLTSQEMDLLIHYNVHDITETEKFYFRCEPAIKMRQELLEQGVLTGDVLNYSDVKIGTEYLIKKIGRQKCFIKGSTPRQTLRDRVELGSVILPKIWFRTSEFEAVKQWFAGQTLWTGSTERPNLTTRLARLDFHFGVGGVHASVKDRRYASSETHVIKDIDVSGMYVAVAIANGFAPEHLGRDFSLAYKQLQADRAQHPKGSMMNAVLKLAGNGVYGNSNNSFSPFYDPKYTFSVTVNGQLQLLQLAEVLSLIPGLELIQANTDGITALVPRQVAHLFDLWKSDWELQTGLKLEEVEYSHMWIRDVNNYVAVTTKGKVKRKGAYWYPIEAGDYDGVWNKDFSNMSAQKGAEACMVHDARPEDAVRLITDPFDFMLRYKTPGGARLYIGDKEQLRTVRYYVSKTGRPMKKVAIPKGEIGAYKRKNKISDAEFKRVTDEIPKGSWDERIHTKNKSTYEMTTTSIESGWLVKECNKASDFNWMDVDYDYYSEEIKKLLIGGHGV